MSKLIKDMNDLISDVQKRLISNDKKLMAELKTTSGETYSSYSKEQLRESAELLQVYLQKYIRYYFDNYTPKMYHGSERTTRRFENSVKIDISSDNGKPSAKVYFDDNDAWRDSLWDGQPQAFLPAILNDGYQVKSNKAWHKNIHHFGYFEGAHFIEAAIIEARKDPLFDGIEIIWEPKTSGYGMG